MAKFDCGQLVATRGVADESAKNSKFHQFCMESFFSHINGDWGNLCDEDKEMNEWALKHGERLLSKYDFNDDISIYIITEWDRSVTTILFPEEY